ncbi:hypothetical protein MTR_2g066740 [Medicago truncatula]|uniref:F-box domain-containing protein n=1 Tax=Medicago truncatula TaxID=3880 RepID=A0A072V885_MEDTR|nr:hypothetical protein MTR_2g066740 [Medicago truncatula]
MQHSINAAASQSTRGGDNAESSNTKKRKETWQVGDGLPGNLLDLELDREPDLDVEIDSSGFPGNLRWKLLRRLPPAGSLSAAKVCKGWRETARKLWKATEELKLRVPVKVHVGFVASMLHKCLGILRLSLRMERYDCVVVLECFFICNDDSSQFAIALEEYEDAGTLVIFCWEEEQAGAEVRTLMINLKGGRRKFQVARHGDLRDVKSSSRKGHIIRVGEDMVPLVGLH